MLKDGSRGSKAAQNNIKLILSSQREHSIHKQEVPHCCVSGNGPKQLEEFTCGSCQMKARRRQEPAPIKGPGDGRRERRRANRVSFPLRQTTTAAGERERDGWCALTELGGDDGDVVPGVLLAVQLPQDVHRAVARVDVEHSLHVGVPIDGVPAQRRRRL